MKGKFGRIWRFVCYYYPDSYKNVTEIMIAEHRAVKYHGYPTDIAEVNIPPNREYLIPEGIVTV